MSCSGRRSSQWYKVVDCELSHSHHLQSRMLPALPPTWSVCAHPVREFMRPYQIVTVITMSASIANTSQRMMAGVSRDKPRGLTRAEPERVAAERGLSSESGRPPLVQRYSNPTHTPTSLTRADSR